MVERSGERWWCAELHRLHGVFLTALGAEETEIEASFCAAISTAREQKSISLEKRAEGTYAEYRRQKASALGGQGSDYHVVDAQREIPKSKTNLASPNHYPA